ncbi:recombinase family protein [Streptomyces sp. NPDC002888]|uniref:recombinase family protein n=1 Tax=Streptomyces sp. NPDC002888 TaxID=3364668 RepID=UPI0036CDD0B5
MPRAGVDPVNIHLDTASGAKASRPKLDLVLTLLREGDTLKVTRLDRLSRSAHTPAPAPGRRRGPPLRPGDPFGNHPCSSCIRATRPAKSPGRSLRRDLATMRHDQHGTQRVRK